MTAVTPILIVVGLYAATMLVVGLRAGRRVNDATDYAVAGRSLPAWLVTLSLFATFFGGGTMMGVAGTAYEKGLLGVIADPFGAVLCLLIATFLFFRVLNQLRLLTLVDYFRERFGRRAEFLAAVCMIPPYIGWVASQFVALGFILHTLTGVNEVIGMIGGATIIVAYTTVGGLWSVTITDALQAVILVIGLTILMIAVGTTANGWPEIIAEVPVTHWTWTPEASAKDWAWYIRAWVVIGLGAIPAQDLMQRAIAARSPNAAVHGGYAAAGLYGFFGLAPIALGFAALVWLPPLENPEFALPMLAIEVLSPVALAFVLGAMIAGIMSSGDSALLAPATVIGENLIRRRWPALSEHRRLLMMRGSVVVMALISLALALGWREIYDLMVGSWSVLLVSLFVPLVAGVYWRRVNEAACVAAILTGLFGWLIFWQILPSWPADLFAMLITIPILIGVTLWTAQSASS